MFDRFDICEAWYLYASDWHGGQWSKEYAIFGRLDKIPFRPRPNLKYSSLSENGKMIYDNLVKVNQKMPEEYMYVVFDDGDNDPTFSDIEGTAVYICTEKCEETIGDLVENEKVTQVVSISKMVEVLRKHNLLEECLAE